LLDDPFSGGAVGNQDTTSNFGYGGGDYGRGNIGAMGVPILNKGYSQAPPMLGGGPMSYGGNTRSQYTGSEIDSEYDTHSQF
jgi:hypothetical protein